MALPTAHFVVTAGTAAEAAAGAAMARVEQQVASLQSQLQEVQAENDDLKAELNAFDPKFFDEIEDLKHDHYLLTGKVSSKGAISSSIIISSSSSSSSIIATICYF
jgi:hypothetical protein